MSQNVPKCPKNYLCNYLNWDLDVDFQWLYFLFSFNHEASMGPPKVPLRSQKCPKMSQKMFNYLNWDVDVDFQWLYFLSTMQRRWVPKIPAVSCFAEGKICSRSFPWSHKCNLYMAWFRGRWLISSGNDETVLTPNAPNDSTLVCPVKIFGLKFQLA